jgi:rhodanese-related sulfurtransferase
MLARILIVALVTLAEVTASGQSLQYACTPCGSSCDSDVYERAGNCRSCGMALVDKSTAAISNLTLEDACKRIAANPEIVLLDVRSAGEFSGSAFGSTYGYFKNAINININELEKRVGELSKYKNKEIVVYCSHSRRSPRATYFLSTQGFKNVKNLAVGVSTFADLEDHECLKGNFVFR